jgi:hypothetical protein
MNAIYHDIERPRTAAPTTSKWGGAKWSNGHKTARNTYPGQGTAPLSHDQKATICIRAREACEHQLGGVPSAAALREWRMAEQKKAVGIESLTHCTQAHYLPLLARFQDLAGESGRAMNTHLEEATAEKRLALHKLTTECTRRGLTLAYVTPICRSKFKCGIEDATPQQLWKLVFDVRRSRHPVKAKAPSAGPLGPLPAKLTITKTGTKPRPDPDLDPVSGDPF